VQRCGDRESDAPCGHRARAAAAAAANLWSGPALTPPPAPQEAQQLRAAGRALPATLIYCPTTAEVDAVAAALSARGLPAGRYHAKMSAAERADSHAAFLRDDTAVLAATIAYGMVRRRRPGGGGHAVRGGGRGKEGAALLVLRTAPRLAGSSVLARASPAGARVLQAAAWLAVPNPQPPPPPPPPPLRPP
jgi:hypothetical protein